MSDPTEPPPEPPTDAPATEPEPPPTEAEAPRRRRRSVLPSLTGAGFALTALALVWVWRHPMLPPQTSELTDTLRGQLSALETRVNDLEQRPTPQAPDLAPLDARITALEQRPAQSAPPAAAPDLGPLDRRITALEQRRPPDLGPLEARITAVEQRRPPDLGPVEARIAAAESASRSAQADVLGRLQADEARIGKIEETAQRFPLVVSATLALSFGQKLGALPGAPPALARFADTPPPTIAELRLGFAQAARNAVAASRPATDGKPLLARLWAQAQDLVTVRQGDRVLIGDPAAGVLEEARAALDAGDVATAANKVASLEGAPAQAMAGWLTQARALLDARAALAAWATSG
jgi:hypothetical protein